jgi:hypothetical protein
MTSEPLRTTAVNPECEWESRHYADVLLAMRQGQQQIQTNFLIGRGEQQKKALVSSAFDTIRENIEENEVVPKALLNKWGKDVSLLQEKTLKGTINSSSIDEAVNGIEAIIEQGVLFEMLDRFYQCNCNGTGPLE